jgi:HAD superfamily hydrolase (TIGR01549 family)
LKELTPLIGTALKEVIKLKLKCNDELAQRLRERYKKIYVKHYLENTKIYKGILELIKELKLKGVKLGIVTSKYGSIARKFLKDLRLASLFDVVIGEGNAELKPSAAPVLYACRAQRVNPKNCILVGDSHNDIICGKKANCKTIAVLWGYGSREDIIKARPDYCVDSVKELRSLLKNQLRGNI